MSMFDQLRKEPRMIERTHPSPRLLGLLAALVGLALLAVAVLLAGATPAAAQDDGEGAPTEEAPAAESDANSYCLVCHSTPGRTVEFPDGSVLDLYVDPAILAHSVHGDEGNAPPLGCTDCHGEDVFPHDEPLPESRRVFTINTAELCSGCHNELLADSAHLEAIAAGNLRAATCVDCHGAHDVPETEQQPRLVAGVCGDCHTDTFNEWEAGPHSDMGSLGCAVCHLPHGQQLRHASTTELCTACHRIPGDIYVHTTHLDSVVDVTCTDCHMGVDPGITLASLEGTPPEELEDDLLGDPAHEPTDHQMQTQIRSCNLCHQEMEETGIWDQIRNVDNTLAVERDELQRQVATLESELEARESGEVEDGTNYLQLILGVLVGVIVAGLLAFLFMPRARRSH